LTSHSKDIPPGVMRSLTRTVIEEPHAQRQTTSPYGARAVAPAGQDEQGPAPVVLVKNAELTSPAAPQTMELSTLPPLTPAPPITVSPSPSPASGAPAPGPLPPSVAPPTDPIEEAFHYYRE